METEKKSNNGDRTSGANTSFWIDSVEQLQFTPLSESIETEVAVIGAGISGITIAYCLAKQGKKVVLIDDGLIGSGETGRTTAHVVNALDDRYTDIEKYHGVEGAKFAAESHTAAIDFIEATCLKEQIDCDFKRVDGYLFLHPTDKKETLDQEFDATHRVGIATELIDCVPGIDSGNGPCLKFPNQAQFHPLKYINALAQKIIELGGEIYTATRAVEVKEGLIKTTDFEIKAEYIVVATNTPMNDRVTMHTKQYPYRTYVIAAKISKSAIITPALWWDTGDQNSEWISMPYNYVRTQDFDEDNYLLICGGADHKTGQADKEEIKEEDRYAILEEWLRKRFPAMQEIVYNWSGQVMEPLDSMGYIGKNPGDKNIFIVTGDSGNGMTHGTIAGILLTDLILGRENLWEKLYSPSRISLKATGDYIKEAANMAIQYSDLLTKGDVESSQELGSGEGAIISHHLKKYAVYKNEEGFIQAYSAVCPHLGCVLSWNGDEKSFDCPCHGSRFTCEGKLVNGPAISDLEVVPFND